ncbi:tannase and feruloyl esterase [Periconia macrospinosa]|uniref:Carboxylic ester hydrolase n=1 Tax=Periconia macrospinosa TaxID=97972 RepID=A0A2V1DCT2_9PLEO|nr:tannase and feruloyl esterase [Periconia macrospinosa]
MVHMEAWLPEEWNERFLAVGTGGLAGCIYYQDLAYATQYGFATVSGNSGHNGTSGSAFFQAPEVLEDFVWRALYATTVVGKEVARRFYSAPHRKAYFMGCSQGGRQGFKAAQRNPEMFDGMVVGAPGLRLPGLFQFFTRWLREVGTDLEGKNATVGVEAWSAVQNETLRQCDGLDGVEDGIIEDTRRCRPDLSKLECGKVGAPGVCLTGKQLDLVDSFFSPWTVNDTLIYPGMVHNGDEASRATVLSTQTMGYVLEWPRYVSRQDLNWTLDQWTPADAVLAVQQNLFNFNTYDGDLSAFRDRGAKIIHYHGQLDNLVDTLVSDQYYDHVSKTMNASPSQLDEFYRYFRISGLQHCTGGPGASALGQGNGSPPPSDKPEDNVLLRIVEWVEGSDGPDSLRGTRFVNDDKAQGVDYRRKHCRYPKRNVYEGNGDGKDEDGWECVD